MHAHAHAPTGTPKATLGSVTSVTKGTQQPAGLSLSCDGPLLSHECIKALIQDGWHVSCQQLLFHNGYEWLPSWSVQVLLPPLILHC